MKFNAENKELKGGDSLYNSQADYKRYRNKLLEERKLIEKSLLNSPKLLYINNIDIEAKISGLKIINVSGRYAPRLKNSIEDTLEMVGGFVSGNQYATRELKIEYLLKGESDSDLYYKIGELIKLLGLGELELFLSDERCFYKGIVTDFEEIRTNTNTIISSFTITCESPYKYSEVKELNINNTSSYKIERLTKNATIERIVYKITMAESKSKIVFSDNTGQEIIFINGRNFTSSDVIELNCITGKAYLNNQERADLIGIESDVENFILEDGNTLYTTYKANIDIYYRERSL